MGDTSQSLAYCRFGCELVHIVKCYTRSSRPMAPATSSATFPDRSSLPALEIARESLLQVARVTQVSLLHIVHGCPLQMLPGEEFVARRKGGTGVTQNQLFGLGL